MNSPATIDFDNVISSSHIAEAFWARVALSPNLPFYRHAVAPSATGTRVWNAERYSAVAPRVARLAHHLAAIGVGVGTPVAILSHTRHEWLIADLAIQTLGGITVSIYQSLPAAEAGFILHDSGAKIIFIENEEQAQKIQWLLQNDCPIPARESQLETTSRLSISHTISFEALTTPISHSLLSSLLENPLLSTTPPLLPEGLTRASTASYVYTSGTTGPPKGVIQTHGNHLSNVHQASLSGVFALDGSLFLFLPLAHSFARLIYYVGALTSASLVLPAVTDHQTSKVDLSSVAKDIQEGDAHVIPSVPRLFEKMAAAIQARASGKTLQQRILRICISNALSTYERRTKGDKLGIVERILFNALTPIRAKIKSQLFGSTFRHGISGGAKLDPHVCRFFDALEIVLCEGYGLTETCVATHVNLPERRKIGSVGPPFEGIELKISGEDGEICLRGPNITQGYLNRPQATREAWDDEGWFHTGDVGKVDHEGFLYITDRKKELVITAGGKKIPPASVEGMFKRFPFVSQAFLYGEGKPYCVMLFTMNEPELRALLSSQGITLNSHDPLASLSVVRSLYESAVKEINKDLASYESIKRFAILADDFTIESGLITPTLKMKRKAIVARYAAEIEELYTE
jgi:long-chain acyl-CoA synthetase